MSEATELETRVAEVVQRLRVHGSDSTEVEVKAAAGGLPKSCGESISALANGRGGLVILGLTEPRFEAAPGFDANAVRDALARVCADDLEPPVREPVEIVHFEGALVVVLEVPPLDPTRRPCHLRRRGPYDGSFIRGGDGDRHLTSYEVTQLLSNRMQPLDDRTPVDAATTAHLDGDAVGALLRRLRERAPRAFAQLDDEAALVRCGVAVLDDAGVTRPTLAGLLCLGTYPQEFFPQLFVSFVALPGTQMGESYADGTRFLDNVTCEGTIPQMVDTVLVAARRNMRTASIIRDAGRQDRYEYPVEVIRELVVNALLHRDYSAPALGTQVQVELYRDRLVVKSPGGLYGSVVPTQLGVEDVSSTRNATLAKLLADVAGPDGHPVCENRGSGLPTVYRRLRDAGMSPPTFDTPPSHVHVTVPHHALLSPQTVEWISGLRAGHLPDEQHLALAMMRERGSVTNEMLRAWGVEAAVAGTALRNLVDRGLAVKRGGRRYAYYTLAAEPTLIPEPAKQHAASRRDVRIGVQLEAVVEALRAGHDSSRAVAERLGLSYPTTMRRLNTLIEQGRVEALGEANSPGRRYRVLP